MTLHLPNEVPKGALITDTHAHYDDKRYNEDYDGLFSALAEKGVDRIINCGCDIKSSEKCLDLSDKYSLCYTAVGYHPCNLPKGDINLSKIEELAQHKKVVAIGEIGLDYYWHDDNKQAQKKAFREQLSLARRLSLPVIIHDRDAHSDTLDILKETKPVGVVHCFSGSKEMALEAVKLGMYIGIGGVLTFKNARKLVEIASTVPIERILLETDAPYMAPEPYRGKTNNSALILFVAQKLAQIKSLPCERVLEITHKNAEELFKF